LDDRGPPPVANSRFAAAAEADRDYRRDRDDRGPPPVANSRFAAAAEADREYRNNDHGMSRDDRGPPPVANSRFAAAAAMAEQEGGYREDGGGRFGRNDGPRGPPIPQNSRFAAAAAADPDYMERGDRERADRDREDYGRRGGFGGRDGYDGRGRGDYGDDRGRGDYGDDRKFGGDRFDDLPTGPAATRESKSSVADLLKPKARPMEENILKIPTKGQEDNFLKPPSKDQAENVLKAPSKESKPASPETKENAGTEAPSTSIPESVDDDALLEEFVKGGKQGEDLKAWVNSLDYVPSVEKLVFHLLTETEKLNPDVECSWAEPSKYGAALVALVEDDILKQMGVLFGVQNYCDKLGMPKLNDEYVIQSMFRAMYKYDLAGDEAFMMWKDDESPEHEAGKINAVIQTVDWFNWLEEDDEEEEEYEE
jgi:eIF4-gamma/eIF5/eIF2-epsilon